MSRRILPPAPFFSTPTLDEQFTGLCPAPRAEHPDACELPPDFFPEEPELSPEEEQQMYDDYLRRIAPPRGYYGVPCPGCGAALFVPEGEAGGVLCPACQRAAVAV